MANDWNRALVLASGRSSFGNDDFGFSFNPVKAIKSAAKAVSNASGKLGDKISSVPVVGKGLHAVYKLSSAGVIETAANVVKGDRIDKAVVGHFKGQLDAARDVAPYVQTIASFVPGVGQGVSGAIGAGVALSRGRPITEAIIEGAKGALPGGPIAAAAFDVALAAAQGKPIDQVALQAIPLPPDQKKMVIQAAMAAKDIAAGKNVAKSLYDNGKKLLPAEAQNAMQVAVAMATAKNLQDAMKRGASEAVPALIDVGMKTISNDPVLRAGLETIKENPIVKKGYQVGSGIAKFRFSPIELNTIRGNLPPEAKKGFDIAMSAHIGKLTSKVKPELDPAVKFGIYAEQGLRIAKPKNKRIMEDILIQNPKIRMGIIKAASERIKQNQAKKQGFWARLKFMITGRS